MILTQRFRTSLPLLLLFPPLALIWTGGSLPQDPSYHHFADTRSLFGIPNVADVGSNVLFFAVAGWGVRKIARDPPFREIGLFLKVFLIGLFLTGLGSSWYHLDPNNVTLFWDRLAMAPVFAAFFCLILGGCLDPSLARRLLAPLTGAALASVCYWLWTEQSGHGDLRFYASIQFGPVLAIPAMLITGRARFLNRRFAWLALGCYVAAKFCEFYDEPIFSALGVVSGHTLKHCFSAFAGAWVIAAGCGRDRATIRSRPEGPGPEAIHEKRI